MTENYSGTSFSPLNQTFIDTDIFRDMDCYEVLSHILRTFNAVIRQRLGYYIIYRPFELTYSQVYGRYFTDVDTFTNAHIYPDQSINRSTSRTDIRTIGATSTMMIKPAAKKININSDYGWKESWLDNWEFKADRGSYIATYYTAQDWNNYPGSLDTAPIQNYISTEVDGLLINDHNSYPTKSLYVYQQFGENAVTSTNTYLL